MKKMKFLIVLIFVLLIVFSCIRFLSKGHAINYKLGNNNEYEIKEIYTKKEKNEIDNYYIEISIGKIVYSYQLFDTYSLNRKIVTDIIYYDGDYKCLLPIIDDLARTDFLCYKDNRFYDYNAIVGKEIELDNFIEKVDINIYNSADWANRSTDTTQYNEITIYNYNIINEHYLGVTNLKGIYLINSKFNNIDVFSKDIYSRGLSAIVGDYYITADYNEKTQFRVLYFIDLTTGKIKKGKAPNYISFDSYIQGIVNNELYLYDKDNEKQYRISTNDLSVTEIGNEKKKIKYYDSGEWNKISTTKANKEILFNYYYEDNEFKKFDYVYLAGNKKSGHYYLFEKKVGYYNVYRAHIQNKKSITYLFQVQDINDVFYVNEYVYYRNKSKIEYYSDITGIRTLIEYSELEFNENLIFGAYEK